MSWWWGVPHLRVGGTLARSWWFGGTLGTPPSRPSRGVPWVPPPSSRPGQGTPYHPDLAGVPPIQTWLEYPPTPDQGWGTPLQTWTGYYPTPDLRWGTPPHHPDLDGVPPPRNVNRQTPVKTVPSRNTTYAGGNYNHGIECATLNLLPHERETRQLQRREMRNECRSKCCFLFFPHEMLKW